MPCSLFALSSMRQRSAPLMRVVPVIVPWVTPPRPTPSEYWTRSVRAAPIPSRVALRRSSAFSWRGARRRSAIASVFTVRLRQSSFFQSRARSSSDGSSRTGSPPVSIPQIVFCSSMMRVRVPEMP